MCICILYFAKMGVIRPSIVYTFFFQMMTSQAGSVLVSEDTPVLVLRLKICLSHGQDSQDFLSFGWSIWSTWNLLPSFTFFLMFRIVFSKSGTLGAWRKGVMMGSESVMQGIVIFFFVLF